MFPSEVSLFAAEIDYRRERAHSYFTTAAVVRQNRLARKQQNRAARGLHVRSGRGTSR